MNKKIFSTIIALVGLAVNSAFAQEMGDSIYNYVPIDTVNVKADFNAILTNTDIDVTFSNDTLHPWIIEDGVAVTRCDGQSKNYSSRLAMSLECDEKVEVTFDWLRATNNSAQHKELVLYIDGILKYSTTSTSYSTKKLILEAGKHTLEFKDSIGNSTATSNYSKIKNLQFLSIKPLETVVLTDKSKPLTFINESEWPWITKDGYVENTNYGVENTSSKFSTTFTIDKMSKLSFDRLVGYWNGSSITSSYSDYHRYNFYINGVRYSTNSYATSYGNISVALEPGTYTLVWEDTIMNSSSTLYTQIKEIELSDDWIEVNVPMPGTLGVEVLYLVDILDDIELLKVKGTINSDDWATINQMNNLIAVDLSEATCASVPNNAFDGLARLSNVKLPEGIASIGDYAFRGTQILNIDIPNSVKSIGNRAFYQTRVRSVNFGAQSQLQSIGYEAFYECTSLSEFIMPDGVDFLNYYSGYGTYSYMRNTYNYGYYTFYGCTSLKKIHFSNALKTIGANVCYGCTNLVDIHLPDTLTYIGKRAFYNTTSLKRIELPETLSDIHGSAFYNSRIDTLKLPIKLTGLGEDVFMDCKNLMYIELPSFIENYGSYFYGCTSVETVVVRSATPPAVSEDPFKEGPDKNIITLKVPSFSVVNYKLDPYWYQFGQIVAADDDVDYYKITGALSLTNNRRMNGKPDIDLYNGGQLMVSGDAPMEIGKFTIFPNQSDPGRLVNMCDAVTADSISTELSVEGKKWYFITPLHDVLLSDIELSNDAMYVFRYYDGANRAQNGKGNSWQNVTGSVLYAGQGYIFQSDKATTIKMPAQAECHAYVFNKDDVVKELATYESDNQANRSWNFVGNPYPCYYDVYYMDITAPITVWTGSTYKAYSIVDDEFVLGPMQAFFVQKPDGMDSIVFHNEGRQLTSEISRASQSGMRSSGRIQSTRYLFNIMISAADMSDETRVVLNDAASLDYETERDASKFISFDSDVPQICTVYEGNIYAINERPLSDGSVKLAYSASGAGVLTISANRSDGTIILYDDLENKSVNLAEQDYSFTTEATDGLNTTRFRLSLCVHGNTTGDEGPAADVSPMISAQNGGIMVSAQEGADILVYNVDGKKIYEDKARAYNSFIPLPSGIYIVKVNAEVVRIMVY